MGTQAFVQSTSPNRLWTLFIMISFSNAGGDDDDDDDDDDGYGDGDDDDGWLCHVC